MAIETVNRDQVQPSVAPQKIPIGRRRLSAVVLLASFALPLMIPTPPVAMSAKYSLVMMHIIGAVVVVGLLVGLGRKRA